MLVDDFAEREPRGQEEKRKERREEIRNRSDIVRLDRYIIVHTMILRCLLNKKC